MTELMYEENFKELEEEECENCNIGLSSWKIHA
jgi:hypothetical protein